MCVHLPGHLWWSPLLVFNFIHSPHGPLHVLNTNKTLVQTQVVAHSILGKGRERNKRESFNMTAHHLASMVYLYMLIVFKNLI